LYFQIFLNNVEIATIHFVESTIREKLTVDSVKGHHNYAVISKRLMGIKDTWDVSVTAESSVPAYVVGFFTTILDIESNEQPETEL